MWFKRRLIGVITISVTTILFVQPMREHLDGGERLERGGQAMALGAD
jgi:hypothetical protein